MKDNMAAARDARVLSRCRAALRKCGREVGSGIGDEGVGSVEVNRSSQSMAVVGDYGSGLGLLIEANHPLFVRAAIKVHGKFQEGGLRCDWKYLD